MAHGDASILTASEKAIENTDTLSLSLVVRRFRRCPLSSGSSFPWPAPLQVSLSLEMKFWCTGARQPPGTTNLPTTSVRYFMFVQGGGGALATVCIERLIWGLPKAVHVEFFAPADLECVATGWHFVLQRNILNIRCCGFDTGSRALPWTNSIQSGVCVVTWINIFLRTCSLVWTLARFDSYTRALLPYLDR